MIFTGGGHTDGDSIVRWRDANVVHMGDLYFNTGGFPFIDTSSGGDVFNAIASIDGALRMMDGDTIVIPGHGPVSNAAELAAYRQKLADMVAAVRAAYEANPALDAVIAARPLAAFGTGEGGFIDADRFATFVVQGLEARAGR